MTNLNRKLSKMDLDDVRSIAKNYFVEKAKGDLNEEQFRTMCYFEAICMMLNIQGVTYPERKNCESIED